MEFILFIILSITAASLEIVDILTSGFIFGGAIVYAGEAVRKDSDYGVLAPIFGLLVWKGLANPTINDLAEVALILAIALVTSYRLMAVQQAYARGFALAVIVYLVSLLSRSRTFSDGLLVGMIAFIATVEVVNRRFFYIAYVSELLRTYVRRLREWRK